jgi:hypothetical protein
MLVYCIRCIDPDGPAADVVHIFSTRERAEAFCDTDSRGHVFYDYVIDRPERMEQILQ